MIFTAAATQALKEAKFLVAVYLIVGAILAAPSAWSIYAHHICP